jgi:hypothetical protein
MSTLSQEQIERNRIALTEALQPFTDSIDAMIDAELARPPHAWDCFIAGWFWLGSAVVSSWGDCGCAEVRIAWLGEESA